MGLDDHAGDVRRRNASGEHIAQSRGRLTRFHDALGKIFVDVGVHRLESREIAARSVKAGEDHQGDEQRKRRHSGIESGFSRQPRQSRSQAELRNGQRTKGKLYVFE